MDASWLFNTFEVLKKFYDLNPFPYLAMGAWLLFSTWYLRKAFKHYQGVNRYLLQIIPFVFTALGLLGAVSGSLGFIWGFTPDDLLSGSMVLFKGLLGSATTAIVGIALSLIFGKLVSMTHYKVETQKALENNELFVLKKMLKLLLKAYAKEQKNVNVTLEALKGVRRDVKSLGPDIGQSADQLQESLLEALKGGEQDSVAAQIAGLRRELLLHTKTLVQQSGKQSQLLERIADSLGGADEQSLANQFVAMREEQRARAATMESSLGSLYEHVGRINVKDAAHSLRTAVQDQTKTLAANLRQQSEAQQEALAAAGREVQQALSQTREEQAARLDNLEELQRQSAQDLAAGQQAQGQALQALGQTMEQTVEQAMEQNEARHNAALEQVQARLRRQAHELAVLAALARQLDPKAKDSLPARLGELQGQVHALASGIEHNGDSLLQGLEKHEQFLQGARQALLEELAGQQAAAAAQAANEAAASFTRDLAPRIRETSERIEQRLQEAEAKRGNEAGQAVAALRRHQTGQFGGLSKQLQELAARTQANFERINELAGRVRDLATDAAALKDFMERAEQTRSSVQDISKLLEQLAQAPGGSNGSGKNVLGNLENTMQQLVSRLREVDAIKKTDGKFWRQVERQMHDGIPIIMGGNKLDLRDDLNGSFQDRLQRSFNNLDKILQAIVSGYQHRDMDSGLQ